MNFIAKVVALFFALSIGAHAHITSLVQKTGTYVATSTSTITFKFTTGPTFIISEDYSLVFGVSPAGTYSSSGPEIGARFGSYDLVAAGLVSTGGVNITTPALSLPASKFSGGSGNYTVIVGLLNGNGPGLTTSVQYLNTPLAVTV